MGRFTESKIRSIMGKKYIQSTTDLVQALHIIKQLVELQNDDGLILHQDEQAFQDCMVHAVQFLEAHKELISKTADDDVPF